MNENEKDRKIRQLYDGLTNIDDELIMEAGEPMERSKSRAFHLRIFRRGKRLRSPKKRTVRWVARTAVVCSLCLIVCITAVIAIASPKVREMTWRMAQVYIERDTETEVAGTEVVIEDVDSVSYKSGGCVEKKNMYNTAEVSLTAGPIYGQTTVYVYVSQAGNAGSLITETATYSLPCTKELMYDTTFFDYDDYKGESYQLNVKLSPYGYQTTTKVEGTYIP
ncbi:MAG: hypothetical protein LUE29_04980 [Lachnospiraceae bacterium]|nr:hypothetical protein [Lachnospiraceae bacterium]